MSRDIGSVLILTSLRISDLLDIKRSLVSIEVSVTWSVERILKISSSVEQVCDFLVSKWTLSVTSLPPRVTIPTKLWSLVWCVTIVSLSWRIFSLMGVAEPMLLKSWSVMVNRWRRLLTVGEGVTKDDLEFFALRFFLPV